MGRSGSDPPKVDLGIYVAVFISIDSLTVKLMQITTN